MDLTGKGKWNRFQELSGVHRDGNGVLLEWWWDEGKEYWLFKMVIIFILLVLLVL